MLRTVPLAYSSDIRGLFLFFLPMGKGKVGLGRNWGIVMNFMLQAKRLLKECSTDPCVR